MNYNQNLGLSVVRIIVNLGSGQHSLNWPGLILDNIILNNIDWLVGPDDSYIRMCFEMVNN